MTNFNQVVSNFVNYNTNNTRIKTSSSKFSIYALAYKDVENKKDDKDTPKKYITPKTGIE